MTANSRQQPFQTLQLNDIVPSSSAVTSAPVASRPSTSTEPDLPEYLQPTTSNGASQAGKSRKRARGGARSGLDADVSAAEDSLLFNKWLSSEIDKNYTKIYLMKAKMELIENLKFKTKLEIQKLQAETIVFSLEP